MCILFCAIYTQTMLRKKNIAKKKGYSCAQNIADYLRIVLDYCLLGIIRKSGPLVLTPGDFIHRTGNHLFNALY